jgi:hypothetical protein
LGFANNCLAAAVTALTGFQLAMNVGGMFGDVSADELAELVREAVHDLLG